MATPMAHPAVRTLIADVTNDPNCNDAIAALSERASEFSSPMAATLAGIAMNPTARDVFETGLDAMWDKSANRMRRDEINEIVIGAGLHAAIYCAVRVAQGFAKPLVIEGSARVGGAFAVSKGPSFYLNSRNRPGDLSLPGLEGALNVIPAGIVQPADLSGDEYQRNNDLAFAIRATLAMNAKVIVGRKATAIGPATDYGDRRYRVLLDDGTSVYGNRVVRATGLGIPKKFTDDDVRGMRIMDSPTFMASLDQPFPLRNMNKLAVIGGGDSGRNAIEALTGQGPTSSWSVASLDHPDTIDWFGASSADSCASWEGANRSRYKGIGRTLQPVSGRARVTARAKAKSLSEGFECVYVDERPYDCAIVCIGYTFAEDDISTPTGWEWETREIGGRIIGRQIPGEGVFMVGPAAGLDVTNRERTASRALADVPENSTSLFRYAGRTAALASRLPEATPPAGSPRAVRPLPPLAEPDNEPRAGDQFTTKGDKDKVVYTIEADNADRIRVRWTPAARDSEPRSVTYLISDARRNFENGVWIRVPEDGNIDAAQAVAKEVGVADVRVANTVERRFLAADARGRDVYEFDRVEVRRSDRFGTVAGVATGFVGGKFVIDLDRTTSDKNRGTGVEKDYTASSGRVYR